jgi:chromosome segregation ATPase
MIKMIASTILQGGQGLTANLPLWLQIVIGMAVLVFGTGGIYALLKLGPERGQIIVRSAGELVIAHSSVLKDLREQYQKLSDEFAELKIEFSQLEIEHGKCQELTTELQQSIMFMHRDLDRHGRMAELSRRKSHAALNAMGGYELLIEKLRDELQKNDVPLKAELSSYKVRKSLREEMEKLDEMESLITEQAIKQEPPT